ncbi:MAG: succinyl-diaminopimelate desuccinylase [Gammaproteobacteria bacterium]|nr:succinyl-diaminopimelate desuccinylase [Gammaproteobacteria bacterium]
MSETLSSYSPTIDLAQALIREPSVTPEDANCQAILKERLRTIGFEVETMVFDNVTNLWATRGNAKPLMVFAGHTDVVPTGPLDQWEIPPFEGVIKNGILHGRGAADMKGSIACFITACERFIASHPNHQGTIGLLITSDEEGPATHGTKAVMDVLKQRNVDIDMCIVGEPTSTSRLGDVVKIGRRGSLGAKLKIKGKQGHIAYPHQADNLMHRSIPALNELIARQWDQGNENFQPTSFQISNINSGTGATNVIPGEMDVLFNFRFSPETTDRELMEATETILQKHGVDYDIHWNRSGQPFETKQGNLVDAVVDSIKAVTGNTTELSTSGGTSDGRFIAPTGAQVLELGPINATIHQIDEQISISDLDLLSSCYEQTLKTLLT